MCVCVSPSALSQSRHWWEAVRKPQVKLFPPPLPSLPSFSLSLPLAPPPLPPPYLLVNFFNGLFLLGSPAPSLSLAVTEGPPMVGAPGGWGLGAGAGTGVLRGRGLIGWHRF